MRGMRGQEPAGQNPRRATQEIRGQRRSRERHRNAVSRVERGAGEGLESDRRQRQHGEIQEAEHDRLLPEQLEAARERVVRHYGVMRAARERAALCGERRQGHQADRAKHDKGMTPANHAAQPITHDRRHRVAETASDPVRAVGVPQPPRCDVGVEDREIRWMEHPVAHTHDERQRKQPEDVGHEPGDERPAREQPDTAEQYRARAEPIDREACTELAEAARDVENADQRPQCRIGDAEVCLEQRKQRRQDELKEVGQTVRRADEADDLDVPAERACGQGIQWGGAGRHDGAKRKLYCIRTLFSGQSAICYRQREAKTPWPTR